MAARRGQTPGMTAAGSRPSRTGRVAAPDCLTHMCHHVHAADQRDLYLALPQTNDHSAVPGPVIASSLLSDNRKDLPQISLTMLVTRRYSSRPLNFAANSPGIASDRRSC